MTSPVVITVPLPPEPVTFAEWLRANGDRGVTRQDMEDAAAYYADRGDDMALTQCDTVLGRLGL